MSEKPTPNEEDIQEEELENDDKEESQDDPTPKEGSDSEKADQEKALSDEAFLIKVNEVEGRDYKSIEDYKKTVAERNKEFSEEGRKDKVEKKDTPSEQDDLVAIFYDSNPKAERVKDDLKKIAKSQGISEARAWRGNDWVQDKAEYLEAKEAENSKNKKKVMSPSNEVPEEKKDADQKAMEKRLSEDLPPGFSE